jgi:hypothetical protein
VTGSPPRRTVVAFVTGLLALLPSGCVVPEGGYGYGGGYGFEAAPVIGLDYYQPYGIVYGGWGPDYHVAPYRPGYHVHEHYGDHPVDRAGGQFFPHAYRPAPVSHAMPSIPSQPRGGGAHFGGARSH